MLQTMSAPAISVTGEATISVAPDQAQIDAGVTSEAKTAREASDINNATMGRVLLALKGAGIEEKDYQTSRLSLQPQYPPNRGTGPSAISGYRASNHVTIRLRDVTKVAGVMAQALVRTGIELDKPAFQVFDVDGVRRLLHQVAQAILAFPERLFSTGMRDGPPHPAAGFLE